MADDQGASVEMLAREIAREFHDPKNKYHQTLSIDQARSLARKRLKLPPSSESAPVMRDMAQRLGLIAEIYEYVKENTVSFELERIGEALAYLFGAIATNDYVQVNETEDEQMDGLMRVFSHRFSAPHDVWNYIRFVER